MSSIREIARRLELTPSTVSHALNNRPGKVSAATRERIFETARALDYVPNPAARALVAGRTGNIGFVSRPLPDPVFPLLLQEIALAVDAQGGKVVACISGQECDGQGQQQMLHPLLVDGILAVPAALPSLDSADSPWRKSPLVLLLAPWNECRAPSVRFDDLDGARQVARHLQVLGHRRLLYLHGAGADGNPLPTSIERLQLLRLAWREVGGNPDEVFESTGALSAKGGRAALKAAYKAKTLFTAIVGYSDAIALGAIEELREREIRVPKDISVIGWNDLDDTLTLLRPSLTSVHTSPNALAKAAVDLLYAQINSPDRDATHEPAAIRVPVHLTRRGSSKAR